MNEELKTKLMYVLKEESEKMLRSDMEMSEKVKFWKQVDRISAVIDNYDEIEPTIRKFFKEKHDKEKWNQER